MKTKKMTAVSYYYLTAPWHKHAEPRIYLPWRVTDLSCDQKRNRACGQKNLDTSQGGKSLECDYVKAGVIAIIQEGQDNVFKIFCEESRYCDTQSIPL